MAEGVRVVEFGIRGVHLAYELLDGYDALVLVDALPMGEPPGTVAVIEAEAMTPPEGDDIAPVMDAHSMSPATVIGLLAGIGGTVDRILVVGCQPETVDEGIGLSEPVAAAVDRAIDVVDELVEELVQSIEPSGRKERNTS